VLLGVITFGCQEFFSPMQQSTLRKEESFAEAEAEAARSTWLKIRSLCLLPRFETSQLRSDYQPAKVHSRSFEFLLDAPLAMLLLVDILLA
jgi:hypothetical protein